MRLRFHLLASLAFFEKQKRAGNAATYDHGGEAPIMLPRKDGAVALYHVLNRFGNAEMLRVPTPGWIFPSTSQHPKTLRVSSRSECI
jgi:hypothetical protein